MYDVCRGVPTYFHASLLFIELRGLSSSRSRTYISLHIEMNWTVFKQYEDNYTNVIQNTPTVGRHQTGEGEAGANFMQISVLGDRSPATVQFPPSPESRPFRRSV